jgi:hypothetical protein
LSVWSSKLTNSSVVVGAVGVAVSFLQLAKLINKAIPKMITGVKNLNFIIFDYFNGYFDF